MKVDAEKKNTLFSESLEFPNKLVLTVKLTDTVSLKLVTSGMTEMVLISESTANTHK